MKSERHCSLFESVYSVMSANRLTVPPVSGGGLKELTAMTDTSLITASGLNAVGLTD